LQICKDNSIVFEAYSPLAHGKLWNNEDIIIKLKTIADKHQVSIAQIMLSWLWAQNIVILPKT
jgi:diketogulonate reductase-like aldo/keto reductase